MPTDLRPAGRDHEAFSLLHWDEHGLVQAVAQDATTLEILMVAWVNREALVRTLDSGYATYYSRSRRCLWQKGETSGYKQRICEVRSDCDGDCLLYLVEAPGAACHQLRRSCFSYRVDRDGSVHCDRPVIA
jgi:phosphoribosyl-AMP cyclohydrolase